MGQPKPLSPRAKKKIAMAELAEQNSDLSARSSKPSIAAGGAIEKAGRPEKTPEGAEKEFKSTWHRKTPEAEKPWTAEHFENIARRDQDRQARKRILLSAR